MKHDEYGEVINHEETYDAIAEVLRAVGHLLIGWTDQEGTHFDILLVSGVPSYGTNIQGGIHPARDLFVSIMRRGAFAFDTGNDDTHPGYYDEKLGGGLGTSKEPLAELLNQVKRRLP